jgi:3-deoxy-7-phosphoheptulonate synthase
MSLEISGTIINESQRIKELLLPIQTSINNQFTVMHNEAFASVVEQIGYQQYEAANVGDLVDTRIKSKEPVISPLALSMALPLSEKSAETTRKSRIIIKDVLLGDDDRLVVIAGPCSLHDPEAVLEYAKFISEMRDEHSEDLEILMRLYSEKPRTELGWKGFVHDPLLNGSEDMNLGLIADRLTALKITEMGVPLSRERLGSNTPQYVNGLISYDSIGARNAEDQNARMYVSGTSSHGGIKNSRDGDVVSAISATISAAGEHSFIGMDENGQQAIVYTKGHEFAHIILRGGKDGPNFSEEDIAKAVQVIEEKHQKTKSQLPVAIGVDASHGNKVDGSQDTAIKSVASQISLGSRAIKVLLTESFIKGGRQDLDITHPDALEYGVSITDACESIDATRVHFGILAEAVRKRRELVE